MPHPSLFQDSMQGAYIDACMYIWRTIQFGAYSQACKLASAGTLGRGMHADLLELSTPREPDCAVLLASLSLNCLQFLNESKCEDRSEERAFIIFIQTRRLGRVFPCYRILLWHFPFVGAHGSKLTITCKQLQVDVMSFACCGITQTL